MPYKAAGSQQVQAPAAKCRHGVAAAHASLAKWLESGADDAHAPVIVLHEVLQGLKLLRGWVEAGRPTGGSTRLTH